MNRWKWRPILQTIRASGPEQLLQFNVPLTDANKARHALWRVSKELKVKGISLETSIDKSGNNGQAILYVYLRREQDD